MSDWTYQALVLVVYDGDTIKVDLDMGMHVWQRNISVRLAGINAPELIGESREKGLLSRDALRNILPVGGTVTLVSHRFEKYGRLLATIYYNGVNVNESMILNGFAEKYDG